MHAYIINITTVEELQSIHDVNELDKIFERAKSTIVNGEHVLLVRKHADGRVEKFDNLTTLEDLSIYKETVYKYL